MKNTCEVLSTHIRPIRCAALGALMPCLLAAALLAPGCGTSNRGATYPSPLDASEALIAAVDPKVDRDALEEVLGSNIDELISSADDVADAEGVRRFVESYRERHGFELADDGSTVLVIGNDEFPFAIPLVKKSKKWSFDTNAGREEMLNRRIGRNELNTIQVCLAYVDAQLEFAMLDTNGDGVREYAQRFRSTEGMRDGLYWATDEGETPSPLGELAAQASAEGYEMRSDVAEGDNVYHGYHFRMLTSQGENAQGGARSYVFDGRMIGGFALIAWPATHGNSGVMTFIVNQDGTVYDKDLGRRTDSIARAMTIFDPDESWFVVNETPYAH